LKALCTRCDERAPVRSTSSLCLWVGLLLTLFLTSACYRNTIKEPPARKRDYEDGEYAASQEQNRPAIGSIYSEAKGSYFQDTRALRVGDIVMVRINEHADARGGASTDLSRSSDRESHVEELMGLMQALEAEAPTVDPSTLWKLMSTYEFSGSGKTTRAGSLDGQLGVRVKKEMPNGDLYVEGTKIVMINHEEYHLYISGVIRTSDILEDNSVDSSLVADARVEFTGRGDIEEQTQQGWFGWFLNKINPF
jgi:flagellar L-ring protein FlgH